MDRLDRDMTTDEWTTALAAARARRRRAATNILDAPRLPSPLHWALRLIMGSYRVLMIHRLHWIDRHHWGGGPQILVSNHGRVTDGFIFISMHRRMRSFIQAESFTLPIIGKVFQHSGQIPVAPGGGMQALDQARAYLAQGDSVLIYPEGKLNHGVGMLRGKVGAARLAFDSRAPLLPIGVYVPSRWSREIHGHFYGRPTIGYWQMGGTCYIAVGEPWLPFPQDQVTVDPHQLRLVTDEMMARISMLEDRARAASG
jgi:1-acyl-sn-glycerol-3-phosphate acyltransferase